MWGCGWGPGRCFHLLRTSHFALEAEQGVSVGLRVGGGTGTIDNELLLSSLYLTALVTRSYVDFSREEHRKHSSGCAFLSVKKQFEELTLGEFLKLDKERAKNKIVCIIGSMSQEPTLLSTFNTKLAAPHRGWLDVFLCQHLWDPHVCVCEDMEGQKSICPGVWSWGGQKAVFPRRGVFSVASPWW